MPRQRLIDARARAFDGTAECHTEGDDLGRVQRRLLKLTWLLVLAAVPVLLAGCGEGVSKEEFEAVQTDLQAARSQVQSLEAEKRELQATAVGGSLEELGRALLIDHIMVFPPTVVELTANSASIQMVTNVPTTCSIVHGLTTAYGEISVDDSMSPGGHTDHYHTLRDLQPDTAYHYKWGLVGPDGTLYGSTDLTFQTPPALYE